MENKSRRSAIPYIVFGNALAISSFFLFITRPDISTFAGIAAVTAFSAISAAVSSLFLRKKKKNKVENEAQTSSGKSELSEADSIVADGRRAMQEMARIYASIQNPEIKQKINELMRVSDKIVQDARSDPSDIPQIRKFLDYYLPTTIKLLHAHSRMSAQGYDGENLSKTMTSIEDMLDTAIEAYKKQLDSLFANQALDIETDINVMNKMMTREGLIGGDDFEITFENAMDTASVQEKEISENGTVSTSSN